MVTLRDEGVVIFTPPGGSAVFGPDQLDQADVFARDVAAAVAAMREQVRRPKLRRPR